MDGYVYSEKMKYPAYLLRFSAPAQPFDGMNWAATERDVFCAGTYAVRCRLENQEIMALLAGRCQGALKVYRLEEDGLVFMSISNAEIAEIIRGGSKWKESTVMNEAIKKLEAS
jgi:hypothetical protein